MGPWSASSVQQAPTQFFPAASLGQEFMPTTASGFLALPPHPTPTCTKRTTVQRPQEQPQLCGWWWWCLFFVCEKKQLCVYPCACTATVVRVVGPCSLEHCLSVPPTPMHAYTATVIHLGGMSSPPLPLRATNFSPTLPHMYAYKMPWSYTWGPCPLSYRPCVPPTLSLPGGGNLCHACSHDNLALLPPKCRASQCVVAHVAGCDFPATRMLCFAM
mmetsp:Transcript_25533/g.75484  ORF Transcript_25533/g.75484 Transcript_25533/m.75484 type:complete len:216 (+) Transcript_25533:281-928(+)